MFTTSAEVLIDRPIEEVFAVIADAENEVHWCPAVLEVEQIAGDGPGLGAKYRMLHVQGGMTFKATSEATVYEPPEHIAWKLEDRGHRFHVSYELKRENGATRLIQTRHVRLVGFVRTLAFPFMGRIKKDMEREMSKQFANLKQLLEHERLPKTSEAT